MVPKKITKKPVPGANKGPLLQGDPPTPLAEQGVPNITASAGLEACRFSQALLTALVPAL